MGRVRLMTWCRTCVSGVHLPAFAAAEGGLFAEQGLEVEFLDCARATDYTLEGFAVRPKAVASGYADFAFTAVPYVLAAQTELGGALGARFAAVCHQRNPITAIVREDSRFQSPADLQGTRAARWSMPWFAQEYMGAMSFMGLDPSVLVDGPDADAALLSVYEPYAFDGGAPGAMHADRWETTIEHTAATHGLSPFAAEQVYRPELLAPAVEYASA